MELSVCNSFFLSHYFAISGSGTTLGVVDLGSLDATSDKGNGTLEQALGVVGCVVIFLGLLSVLLCCLSKGKAKNIFLIVHLFILFRKKGKNDFCLFVCLGLYTNFN